MKEKIRKIGETVIFCVTMILIGVIIGLVILNIINNIKKNQNSETRQISNEQKEPIDEAVNYVIVEELISEHTINNSSSSENRNINMQIAAQIINGQSNGYVLQPGETFSWISIVGCTSEDKGFKIAPIIFKGKNVLGLGGGVCQVSTTINTAILKIGIPTHAEKHSKRPTYLSEEDAEATVSFDSGIDFCFENTLKYPIRINVETQDGKVTVRIFSIKEVPEKEA